MVLIGFINAGFNLYFQLANTEVSAKHSKVKQSEGRFAWTAWASLVAQMVKNLPAIQETQVRSLDWEDLLEKGTTTHSSILAWTIAWTEEAGGLQFMGSQRVGTQLKWLSMHARRGSQVQGASKSPAALDKAHLAGPITRVSGSQGLGWDLRTCILNRFPHDSAPVGQGTPLWEPPLYSDPEKRRGVSGDSSSPAWNPTPKRLMGCRPSG